VNVCGVLMSEFFELLPFHQPPSALLLPISLSPIISPPFPCTMDQIFDEEDLLAIANDGDSSSGHADEDSAVSSVASPQVEAKCAATDDAAGGRCVQAKIAELDYNSDDEDDGFLDNWLTDLKNSEHEYQDKKLGTNQIDADVEEPDIDVENIACPSLGNEGASDIRNDADGDSATPEDSKLHLGTSVLKWISDSRCEKMSSAKRRKIGLYDGKDRLYNHAIIGIQRDVGCDDDSQLPSVLSIHSSKSYSLTTHSKPTRLNEIKHTLRFGTIDVNTAVLKKAGNRLKQFRGDVVSCASQDRTIDCLARYDNQKQCYILEIVDMTVSNLQPDSGSTPSDSAADVADTLSKHPEPLVDPRLLAKRAEAQVKKLKREKTNTKSVDGGRRRKSSSKEVTIQPED
jgi:hypothetical protein